MVLIWCSLLASTEMVCLQVRTCFMSHVCIMYVNVCVHVSAKFGGSKMLVSKRPVLLTTCVISFHSAASCGRITRRGTMDT